MDILQSSFWKEKDQKELQFRRKSMVNIGFSLKNEIDPFMKN
jgi:hypothetical protein